MLTVIQSQCLLNFTVSFILRFELENSLMFKAQSADMVTSWRESRVLEGHLLLLICFFISKYRKKFVGWRGGGVSNTLYSL